MLWVVDIQIITYFMANFLPVFRFNGSAFIVIAWYIDVDGWKIVFGYSAFRYTDNIKANFKQTGKQL